jgi:hypothetical protein
MDGMIHAKGGIMKLTRLDAVALALALRGGRAHLNRLYDDVPRIYGKRPATSDEAVRDTVESNSSDSKNFDGRKDLFTAPLGLGSGVWSLRAMDWNVGDVISFNGQVFLLTQIVQVYPSSMSGGGNAMAKLKTAKLVEFAQTLLPGLPFWKNAS